MYAHSAHTLTSTELHTLSRLYSGLQESLRQDLNAALRASEPPQDVETVRRLEATVRFLGESAANMDPHMVGINLEKVRGEQIVAAVARLEEDLRAARLKSLRLGLAEAAAAIAGTLFTDNEKALADMLTAIGMPPGLPPKAS